MVERLTDETQIGPFAALKDKAEAVPGAFGTYDCLYAHMVAVTRLKQYEDAVPLERAKELAQAEKDGRLAILPCQIGAPVWWITLSWVEKTVTVRYTIESGKFRYAMLDWQNPVYTSQAAAEAALAEMAKEGTTSEKSHSD